MKFRQRRHYEPPEINFIPLIDVLLVILIFLMVTTTYSRYSQLDIRLPTQSRQEKDKDTERPDPISIAISKQGELMIGEAPVSAQDPKALVDALERAAAGQDKSKIVVLINADAEATHQNVVRVMETARSAGFVQLTFATQHINQ